MGEKDLAPEEEKLICEYALKKWNTDFESVTGTGYENDFVQTINNAAIISAGDSYEYESTLMSFFGRINYAYDDKYFGHRSPSRLT